MTVPIYHEREEEEERRKQRTRVGTELWRATRSAEPESERKRRGKMMRKKGMRGKDRNEEEEDRRKRKTRVDCG